MSEHRKNLLPMYLKGLVSGKYTLKQAAESTGYSVRYMWELKRRYLKEGMSVLEHRGKHRIAHNKTSVFIENAVVAIYAAKYKDVNFKFFRDCLEDFENIKISYPTLLGIMKRAGVRSPESRKVKRTVATHRPRMRRQNEGDLLQLDGTPYAWFYKSGDNNYYALHGCIDDATGKITGLYFTQNECLYGYMEVLRQTINNYGVPRETYTDRAAIFCVTPKNKKNLTIWEELAGIHDKRTQWQRILSDLSINQILAWSPQAKGRVERMWHTLQGQLPQWFYNMGIKTVEEANKKIHLYIKKFNEKYGVKPEKNDSFYRPLEPNEDIEKILTAQFPKKTDHTGCFIFQGEQFYLRHPTPANKYFMLHISDLGIYGEYENKYYDVSLTSNYIQECKGDAMPQVVKDIVYRYLLAFAKEISV